MNEEKEILYYRILKDDAVIDVPGPMSLVFKLNSSIKQIYQLGVTEVIKATGLKHPIYIGYLCNSGTILPQLEEFQVWVSETEFKDDKEYTKDEIIQIYHPCTYMTFMSEIKTNKCITLV